MARGWESKAVEEQINDREQQLEESAKPILTPAELKERTRREGLLLARNHTLQLLNTATNERYRKILTDTLAHIDTQLLPDPDLDS